MFRFEIGQKVVLCNSTHPENNGIVGVVVERENLAAARFPNGETLYNVNLYRIDNQPIRNGKVTKSREDQLAPVDDPGSWEDCIWKPDEIVNKG